MSYQTTIEVRTSERAVMDNLSKTLRGQWPDAGLELWIEGKIAIVEIRGRTVKQDFYFFVDDLREHGKCMVVWSLYGPAGEQIFHTSYGTKQGPNHA